VPRPVPTRIALQAPARARGWSPNALPPVLLGISVAEDVDLTTPAVLLERCARVGAVVNPALEAVLADAGACPRDSRSWDLVIDGKGAIRHDKLTRVLRALVAGACLTPAAAAHAARRDGPGLARIRRPPVVTALNQELRAVPSLAAALAEAGVRFDDRRHRNRARNAGVVLRRAGRVMQLTVVTVGFGTELAQLAGLPADALDTLRPSSVRVPAAITVADVENLLDLAATHQIGVVDATTPARIAALRELAAAAIVIDRVPGAPGLAGLRVGALVDGTAEAGVRSAAEGLAVAGTHHLTAPVAVHPDVVEAADQALAGPTGRPGLREYQDHFVSVYAATTRGALNALDPGMGKTVTTAAGFAEKAERMSGWRGLIAVPAGLREQWRGELDRFFPAAHVAVPASPAEFAALPATLGPLGPQPAAVLVSHEAASRYVDTLERLAWDDIACDEADWLRSLDSARTKALWRLRAAARCGVALTGTPVDRALDNVAALIAWSRHDREILRFHDADEETLWRRLGACVFRGSGAGRELPEVRVRVTPLVPAAAEERIAGDALAELRVAHLQFLAAAAATDRRGTSRARLLRRVALDAARVASCDPVAFAAAKAASRVEPELLSKACADGGVKRIWAVETAARAASTGGQTLVCTEFPAAANAVAAAAADAGLRSGALTGDVAPMVRTSLAAAFMHGQLDVLCLSGAGARGLNLQTATDVVNLDLPTSAATLRQRAGRAVRIGSSRTTVTVHVPILPGSIDEILLPPLQPALERLREPDNGTVLAINLTSDAALAELLSLPNSYKIN
jgi:hypothetical protein